MGIEKKYGGIEGLDPNWQSLILELRLYLRDFAPLNRLLENEESNDRDLLMALLHCVEDINGTPPVTDYPLVFLFQQHQRKLILEGAACNILESVIFHYSRNSLRFTDSGISVAVDDKADSFLRLYLNLKTEYEQKKLKFKQAANMESITVGDFVGFHSEYLTLLNLIRT